MSEILDHVALVPFEAARRIDGFPAGHRCGRPHGHGFRARVQAALPASWVAFPGAASGQLRDALARCVAPLDYDWLNHHLAMPTDPNLAQWVGARLEVPGVKQVGIQSTRDEGVEADRHNRVRGWRRFRFEAAHRLPHVPVGHKCGRMHGHGFEVIVHVDRDAATGDSADASDRLAHCWEPLGAELHLACLNDIPGLETPTSERLARWIWNHLRPQLPDLAWVSVYETATAGCHYDGATYRIWKDFPFESAIQLVRAPAGDRRRRLHGHSYLARLQLTAPLDQVMGWTVDYGDVKERFKPAYEALDHRCLNELAGNEEGDAEQLAHWIRERMEASLPPLDRIELYETPGCGVVLAWGPPGPALPL